MSYAGPFRRQFYISSILAIILALLLVLDNDEIHCLHKQNDRSHDPKEQASGNVIGMIPVASSGTSEGK